MGELLRPVLRRALMLVGICALVLAAAFVDPTPKAFGLFNAGHATVAADCLSEGASSGAGLVASEHCSIHSGCVATGVLSAGPAVATAFGRDWTVAAGATVADWADFPTNPPPIAFL
jgi:hypothetical protein